MRFDQVESFNMAGGSPRRMVRTAPPRSVAGVEPVGATGSPIIGGFSHFGFFACCGGWHINEEG
jgi:hypothetical protein